MPRILLIDDENAYFKMVDRALKSTNFELFYVNNGLDGLKLASENPPDVIIIDIMLPDIMGFDVAQRLRSDPRFEKIPIMFLTSQTDVNDKVRAFEIGADDYLIKPFQPEELVARLNLLCRRGEALKNLHQGEREYKEPAVVVGVHSLRGGVGCSSIAVNLAMSYYTLWGRPTMVVDGVLNTGQVSLMLNTSISHSWEDLIGKQASQIDDGVIEAVVNKHKSGMDFFPAPGHPIAYDSLPYDTPQIVLNHFRLTYDCIVIDMAHDFSNFTINMLTNTNTILLMLAPEMASIRAAVSTLQIYDKLGFSPEKVLLVLNNTFMQPGIKQAQIEKVLKRPIRYTIPHIPNEFVRAINFGEPLVTKLPESPASEVIEEIAFDLSQENYKNIPPVSATNAWKRISERTPKKQKKSIW
jgi:CheY-like chemotaxis protein/MinD-like ATPase involved in chromosome partitioning or flagellar assembly